MKTSFAYQAGGLRDGSFQGQPAQVYEGNSGKYWNWEVLFERGGWWFRISVMSPSESEAEDHVREDLLPYVHSFQVDKEKAHHSDK